MACKNPFSSRERQHFPEFSPMFRKTPSKAENNSFRWSIDNIARLKPAEIATDPANLVKTNGQSPDDDREVQRSIDTFFSQKTILPSPWPVARQPSKPIIISPEETKPAHVKKVTFSPLPPATAFIRNDSLVESDVRDSQTVDAGTQTVLTFPVDFDLEQLLVSQLPAGEEDKGNCSLRRKLFGKPERQDESPSPTESMQLSGLSPTLSRTQPSCDYLQSPMIQISEEVDRGDTNPACSSFLLKSPLQGLPDFSPIGEQTDRPARQVQGSPGFSPINIPVQSIGPTRLANEGQQALTSTQATPKSKSGLVGCKRNRSLLTTAISPIGMLPPRVTPEQRDRGSACTSTPNTAVTKQRLTSSPFASPVLKQQCTQRHDVKETQSLDQIQAFRVKEEHSSVDMAEPLSLDDLRTETLELTNITPTSCTDYFTNLDLDSQQANSTNAQVKMDVPTKPWAADLPKAHSTMVDYHLKQSHLPETNNRQSSRPPSQSSMTGGDSGVAASGELNPSVDISNKASSELKTPGYKRRLGFAEGRLLVARSDSGDSGLVFSPGTPSEQNYSKPFSVGLIRKPHLPSTQSVLPSRYRFRTVTSPHCVAKYSNTPNYSNTPRAPSPIGQLLQDTPPSRYTKYSASPPSEILPNDVLRRKKLLKARLQFGAASSFYRQPLSEITSHSLHTRHLTRPASPLKTLSTTPLLSPIGSPLLGNPATPPWRWQTNPHHKENLY